MSTQTTSVKFASIARWALFSAVGLMAVALIATVYSTHRGIADASDTLVRGQSTVFGGLMRRLVHEPTTKTELAAILEQHSTDGLRYVAVLDADGAIELEAGEPPDDRSRLVVAGQRFRLSDVGERTRLQLLSKPSRPGFDRRQGAVVLEFVPEIANDLRADARRSLFIAAFAGVLLLVIAMLLIRWFVRQQILERQLTDGRRLAALGEMSATLAHEIRNPIASLKGNAQLLARMLANDGGKTKAKADRVVSESVRLETITNDLLEFARTGSISRADVSPVRIARDVASRVSERAVRVESSGAPAKWSIDERRITQVLDNLVDNAVDANPADAPPVIISVTASSDELIISVRDHGSGVAADNHESIFAPFFTDKTHGTGLGLAVARRIVRLHGGDLVVTDAKGGGAKFTFTIPKDD